MINKREHTYESTYIRTYGTGPYPLHNFVVRGDNNVHHSMLFQIFFTFSSEILSVIFVFLFGVFEIPKDSRNSSREKMKNEME